MRDYFPLQNQKHNVAPWVQSQADRPGTSAAGSSADPARRSVDLARSTAADLPGRAGGHPGAGGTLPLPKRLIGSLKVKLYG